MRNKQIRIAISVTEEERELVEKLQKQRVLSSVIQKVIEREYNDIGSETTLKDLLISSGANGSIRVSLTISLDQKMYPNTFYVLSNSDRLTRSLIVKSAVKRVMNITVDRLLSNEKDIVVRESKEAVPKETHTVQRERSSLAGAELENITNGTGVGVHDISEFFR